MTGADRPQRTAYIRVRVTPSQLAAIESVAARDGATVSEVLRLLIAEKILAQGPACPPSGYTPLG